MDFKTAFSNTRILVPTLQRDYVQGAIEDIIAPFMDKLLTEKTDLNYIYGYEEDGAFIPVDGQQRLITLWLLYSYVWSRKQKSVFNVSMSFQTREFADEFCSRIIKNLPQAIKLVLTAEAKAKQNKDKIKDTSDNGDELIEKGNVLSGESGSSNEDRGKVPDVPTFDVFIEDCHWFIPMWKKNVSVSNMLRTLKIIHSKINEANLDDVFSRLFSDYSAISFAFLRMTEENGLDDDIYIKMNGRGRPLSQFENLKSWIDERVGDLSFGAKWKSNIDNRWIKLFWQNRNLTQEHPEEIDDEQLHLFCNLLLLFHLKYPYLLTSNISNSMFREEAMAYFEVGDQNASDQMIADSILERLAIGKMPSLIWIERLNIMPYEFLLFTFYAVNRLCARSKEVNESKLYFIDSDGSTTDVYNLSMTKATITRTLPLLYAVLRYKDNSKTKFYDWIRVLRNLIVNIDRQEKDILPGIMASIDRLSTYAKHNDIFHIFANLDENSTLYAQLRKAFAPRQINEERQKALKQYEIYRPLFAELENLRFFAGRINVLFSLIEPEDFSIENIKSVVRLMENIFDGGDYGISEEFDDSNHYFRRILMCYGDFGIWRSNCWCFCNGLGEWRSYVSAERQKPEALIAFSREFAPKNLTRAQLLGAVKDKVEDISKNYLKDIEEGDSSSYRYHFIHHPGVWSYMKTQLAKWGNEGENPYDIVLKKTNSNNSNHMELRTYCLYLDYKYEKDSFGKYSAWHLWEWPTGVSCFNFEKDMQCDDGCNYKIAIDVFFKGVDEKRDSENCYGYNIFIRTAEEEDAKSINADVLLPICGDLFAKLGIVQNEINGRFVNIRNLSRPEIIKNLNILLAFFEQNT